jgi:homoserine acetyltransferase
LSSHRLALARLEIARFRLQTVVEQIDANDILYSLKSSSDYDPEPGLTSIKAKLFALNFNEDEFNPDELQILEHLITNVPQGSLSRSERLGG